MLSALSDEIGGLAKERLTGRIPLLLTSYNYGGNVKVHLLDKSFHGRSAEFELTIQALFGDCIHSGLKEVFKPSSVLLEAPSGYAYYKPRGSRSKYFIKPDMALETSAAVSFVALAVFHKCIALTRRGLEEFEQIFVDSMAIAPIAYELRRMLEEAGAPSAISIESFHSYRGFDGVPRPLPSTSLCIISASSSMSLHDDWIVKKQVSSEEVVTLLTFNDARNGCEGALAAIPRPESDALGAIAPLSIHIKGESFLPVPEPTKKVLLVADAHKCPAETRLLQEIAGTGIVDVFRRTTAPGSKPRAIFIDGFKLVSSGAFKDWLRAQLRQRFKASMRLVVYQDDGSSQMLANLILEEAARSFDRRDLQAVSTTELSDAQLDADDGVLICAAVSGKGSQLLQVSRDLRDKQRGPRLYLVGAQVTELRSEIATLTSNLQYSKTAKYELVRYAEFAVGSSIGRSFQVEQSVYYPLSLAARLIPLVLSDRRQTIGGTGSLGHRVFLPAASDLQSALELRQGFAFWQPGYTSGPLHAEILASVCVILQNAREMSDLPADKRLRSDLFGHVALDPANFTRFNDGIIQAALLRAAKTSELDYRADYAASDFMRALLVKMIERSREQTGEALLEFLQAIGVRHLQLAPGHEKEVRYTVEVRTQGELQRVCRFLLDPPKVSRESSDLPF